MRKVAALFTVALLLALPTSAQVKRKVPQTVPAPLTPPIEAITKDGRRAELNSDGTWKWIETKPGPRFGSIDFKAAVIFQSGEVVPVPRSEFYLLTDNLESLLFTPEMRQVMLDDALGQWQGEESMVKMAKDATFSDFLSYALSQRVFERYYTVAGPIITKAIKFKVMTDFEGNGIFPDLAPGRYYLFGYTKLRKTWVAWHIPVDVSSGVTKITLDTTNRL